MAELVRCPECRSPVVKSSGCNAITCAVCRINFDFLTGRRCVAGNHTTDAKLVLTQPQTLPALYAAECAGDEPLRLALTRLEARRPKEVSFEDVARLFGKLAALAGRPGADESGADDKQDAAEVSLAAGYARHIRSRFDLKRFHARVQKVHEMRRDGRLSAEAVRQLLLSGLSPDAQTSGAHA